jgi:hypothetical protein
MTSSSEAPPGKVNVPANRNLPIAEEDYLTSFGEVFANEKAVRQIFNRQPLYPVGSIIGREKHDERIGHKPEKVIAMVKRENGFSPETGDWEFLMFDGQTLSLTMRETVGSCAACHAQAKQTDWSFRSYLNAPLESIR